MQVANFIRISCLALMSAGAFGCERRPPEREVSLASEPVTDTELWPASGASLPDAAADAIAEARCERERRCGNIGEGRTYESRFECRRRVLANWADDLNAIECSRGVHETSLAGCLRELRETECDDLRDTLGRWMACEGARICDRGR